MAAKAGTDANYGWGVSMSDQPKDFCELSLDEKVDLFVGYVFGGEHHVRKLSRVQHYYVCVPHGSLSTFDGDNLTRVVLASHMLGLRADVENHGMRGVRILLHNRPVREGRFCERHPTIDKPIKKCEEWFYNG